MNSEVQNNDKEIIMEYNVCNHERLHDLEVEYGSSFYILFNKNPYN